MNATRQKNMLLWKMLLITNILLHVAGQVDAFSSHMKGVSRDAAMPAEDKCTLKVADDSKTFFKSRLIALTPNFIQFKINFDKAPNYTAPEAFLPTRWVWTYNSTTANYPYLYWNIDHGLLSFGLLDVKTCYIEYVNINVTGSCNLSLGENDTNWRIVDALSNIFLDMYDRSYHKYEQIFFCYLEIVPGVQDTLEYQAALYLKFPVSFLKYRCCNLIYKYQTSQYHQECSSELHEKWKQCTVLPYILGVVLFLYFPIYLFKLLGWLAINEKVKREDHALCGKNEIENLEKADGKEWIYLDGTPPITLFGALTFIFDGHWQKYKIFVSRIRRLICVLIAPVIIFIQIQMYSDGIGFGDKISMKDLVKIGTPVGFLSILGEPEDRIKVFVPILGGPVGLLVAHYVLAIVFFVFPRSLKQIVERGLPRGNKCSPLFLGIKDILEFSMLRVTPEPGYESASVVCKGSICMLFTTQFWKHAIAMQRARAPLIYFRQSCVTVIAKAIILPVYIIFCIAEMILCMIYYFIPLFSLVSIIVTGVVKSLLMLRLHNRCMFAIFRNRFTVVTGTLLVLSLIIYYFYSTCLIFTQIFNFISQVIIFCFVAVIVYPSVAFGYLFFFLVLVFYFIRLIKEFDEGYLELLTTAVEKSRDLYRTVNHAVVDNRNLNVIIETSSRLRGIRINDSLLNIPANVFEIRDEHELSQKLSFQENMFGIPKELFHFLIMRHRPMHMQILKVLFQLCMVILLVSLTINITSMIATGASSEISDVMHVVFIVAVGALPHVLEVALINTNESIKLEIESRHIEHSIKEFWIRKSEGTPVYE